MKLKGKGFLRQTNIFSKIVYLLWIIFILSSCQKTCVDCPEGAIDGSLERYVIIIGDNYKSYPSNFTYFYEKSSNDAIWLIQGESYDFSSTKGSGAADYLPHKWIINGKNHEKIVYSYTADINDSNSEVIFHYSVEEEYDTSKTFNLFVKLPITNGCVISDTNYLDGLFKKYGDSTYPYQILKAITKKESEFNVNAVNGSYYGLMQVAK